MCLAISVIALLLATGGVLVALRRPKVEPSATDKAFRRLESDVEGIFEKVESHLGRISRLKRGSSSVAAPALPSVEEKTKPLSRAALYASARRNYADKNRHGVGEQRPR